MLNGASWRCKRKRQIALSSAEAEFIAASSVVQEVIFLCKFLDNLGFKQNRPTPIFADNETCIHWSEGSVGGNDRAKHFDLRIERILYMMHTSKAFFSFRKLILNIIVQIS
jgi:hypothetical protein